MKYLLFFIWVVTVNLAYAESKDKSNVESMEAPINSSCYQAINPDAIQLQYTSKLLQNSIGKSANLRIDLYKDASNKPFEFQEVVNLKIKAKNLLSPSVNSVLFNFFKKEELSSEIVEYNSECDGGYVSLKKVNEKNVILNTDYVSGASLTSPLTCFDVNLNIKAVLFTKVVCKE